MSWGPPTLRQNNWPAPDPMTFQIVFSPDLKQWVAMYSSSDGVMFDTQEEALKFHGAYRIVPGEFAREMIQTFVDQNRVAHL